MDYERLHVGHIRKKREYLQGVDKLPGVFLITLDLESEDRACAVGIELVLKLMILMLGQRRMIHFRHFRMVGEEFHHLKSVLHMTLHAQ